MKINFIILLIMSIVLLGCGNVEDINIEEVAEIKDVKTEEVKTPLNKYFKIGGSISGLNGPVELSNNQVDNLLIEENGNFEFSTSLIDGSEFLVESVNSENTESQYCIILNGNGTIDGADIMNIMVICINHIISRVSISDNNEEGNGRSYSPSMNYDGRFVSFTSTSNNLVLDDENGYADVFVRDTFEETTSLISINSNNNSSESSISDDGRYVSFRSGYIYLHDSYTGDTDVITFSQSFSMSNDGRYIAFESNNNIYVYDTQTGQSSRVSVTSNGFAVQGRSYSPSISGDGRYVIFNSDSTTLVSDDTNGVTDVFMHDTETGETIRVSVDSNGFEANNISLQKSISYDGKFVVFDSTANNLVSDDMNNVSDVFLYNTDAEETSRVSVTENGEEGNGESYSPSISDNGRYVAYTSYSSNLITSDYNGVADVFVYDTLTGELSRVSKGTDFSEGLYESHSPSISGNGKYITFTTKSSFVFDDFNDIEDVYKVKNPLF